MDNSAVLLLRFFASSLLGNFALFWKKYQSAPSLLRFYASWRQKTKRTGSASGKFRLCYFASSLPRFWKKFLRKNHPSLLRFLKNCPQKNQALLLRFYASWKIVPKQIRPCFFASTLLRFLKKIPWKISSNASSRLCFLAILIWKINLWFFACIVLEKNPKKTVSASSLLGYFALKN